MRCSRWPNWYPTSASERNRNSNISPRCTITRPGRIRRRTHPESVSEPADEGEHQDAEGHDIGDTEGSGQKDGRDTEPDDERRIIVDDIHVQRGASAHTFRGIEVPRHVIVEPGEEDSDQTEGQDNQRHNQVGDAVGQNLIHPERPGDPVRRAYHRVIIHSGFLREINTTARGSSYTSSKRGSWRRRDASGLSDGPITSRAAASSGSESQPGFPNQVSRP